MSWTTAQINNLRLLVNDDATSKQSRAETPQNTRNNSRVVFQVLKYPIVVTSSWTSADTDATKTSVYLTSNTTVRSQTGFKVDPVNGLLTFSTAPVGTEDPWYVDYYWQWFADASYTAFLDLAAYDIGYSPTATLPDGLTNAWYHYGKHHFFKAMASKYASRFNSSGGGQGQQVDVVTQSYRKLADEAWNEAETMKAAFAKRHGRRDIPSATSGKMGIDPWTPMR